MINRWRDRPLEEAYLLNPAFLAAIIAYMARGYKLVTGNELPLSLAFLGAGLSLSHAFRLERPRTITTSMSLWIHEHPSHRIYLNRRIRSMADFIREGLLFGSCHGGLMISPRLTISEGTLKKTGPVEKEAGEEFRDAVKCAEYVGRWFGESGDASTILILWGIQP